MSAVPWGILLVVLGRGQLLTYWYDVLMRPEPIWKRQAKRITASAWWTTGVIVAGLVLSAVGLLTATAVYTDENIIASTGSRMVTSGSVIETRLAAARPLTSVDQTLLGLFRSQSARILYTLFGPKPLVECTWCERGEDNHLDRTLLLWYSLPAIAMPYLCQLVIVGLATVASTTPRALRFYASLCTVLAGLWEFYTLATFDLTRNAATVDPRQVHWVHWTLSVQRNIGFAVVQLAMAAVIYLTASGLVRFKPAPPSQRVADLLATLSALRVHTQRKRVVQSFAYLTHTNSMMESWKSTTKRRKIVDGNKRVVEARKEVAAQIDAAGPASPDIRRHLAHYADPLFQSV